jgi:hypothetical protein
MDLSAFWSTQELSASLRHLPPAAHLLAAGGVIVGLVLWGAGEKILRIVFAALGALVGAALGFFLLPTFAPEMVLGFPSPHVGLFAGSMVGLIFTLTIYRIAVAVLLAGGLSVAAMLVAGAVVLSPPLSDHGIPGGDQTAHSSPASAPDGDERAAAEARDPGSSAAATGREGEAAPLHAEGEGPGDHDRFRGAIEAVGPMAERIRVFVAARWDEFGESWGELAGRQQAVIVSAALSGAVVGFVLGFLFPRRSAAAATAMSGAAVAMPAFAWLFKAMEAPGAALLLSLPPIGWLIIWMVAAAAGFTIQSVSGRRA